MSRRRCRNCPEPPKREPTPPPKPLNVVAEEGAKLWDHSLYACHTVVEMMAGYAALGVPGGPLRGLQKLAARIQQIIKTCESHDASSRPLE